MPSVLRLRRIPDGCPLETPGRARREHSDGERVVSVTPNEAVAIFAVFERGDDYESLIWRVETKPYYVPVIKLFATCNDVFFWATADAGRRSRRTMCRYWKPVSPTWRNARTPGPSPISLRLFAARKRHMRPQKPFYKDMPEDVAALFDACCTAEERAEAEEKDAAWWIAVAHKLKDKTAATGNEAAA